MPVTIRRAHPAMNTLFEAWLRGDDPEHLDAVANAVFDEVDRVERLLSRFHPGSETSRINRDAGSRSVLVGHEMLEVFLQCRAGWRTTGGAFDVTLGAGNALHIDAERRTVQFLRPGVALDFGGFGKGYALDRAIEIVVANGVEHALLHGGRSSILARGHDGGEDGWPVDVPGVDSPLRLRDEGFSCSAAFGHNQEASDVIDPHTGRPLTNACACWVVRPTASLAEIDSTGFLAMGRERAAEMGRPAGWSPGRS